MMRIAVTALVVALAAPVFAQPAPGSGEAPLAAPEAAPEVAAPAEPTPTPDAAERVVVALEAPEGPFDVGAPVHLVATLAPPTGFEVLSASVAGNRFVEVLAAAPPVVGADGRVTVALDVAVFRSGTFEAEVEVTLLDGAGNRRVLATEPFALEVRSSIVNEASPEPAPSDPPLAVLTRDLRPLYAGVALGCVLFGFVLAWVLRIMRRRRVVEALPPAPTRPAWEVAMEALDALEDADLLGQGEHLLFHMRLSEILRAYIGARFGFLAPEMTTSEISAWLRARPEEAGTYREEIVEVLSDMDIVKFARFTPELEFSERCLSGARRLVTELSARDRERGEDDHETVEDDAHDTPVGPHDPSPAATTRLEADAAAEAEVPDNVVPWVPRVVQDAKADPPPSPRSDDVLPDDADEDPDLASDEPEEDR